MSSGWDPNSDEAPLNRQQTTQPWQNKPLLSSGMPTPDWNDPSQTFGSQLTQVQLDAQQGIYPPQAGPSPIQKQTQLHSNQAHSIASLELISDHSDHLSSKRSSLEHPSSFAPQFGQSSNPPLLQPSSTHAYAEHHQQISHSNPYPQHSPLSEVPPGVVPGQAFYGREFAGSSNGPHVDRSAPSHAHRHSLPYPPTQHLDWPAPHASSHSHPHLSIQQPRPGLHPLVTNQSWAGTIARPSAYAVHPASVGLSWDGSASEPSSGVPSPIQADRGLPGVVGGESWSAGAVPPSSFDPWYGAAQAREGSHYHQPIQSAQSAWQSAVGPSSAGPVPGPSAGQAPPLLGRSNSYHYGDSAHYQHQRTVYAPQQQPLYEQHSEAQSAYSFSSYATAFPPAESSSALPAIEASAAMADSQPKRSRATTDPGAPPALDGLPPRKTIKTSAKGKRASISGSGLDASVGPTKRKLAVDLHATCQSCGIALARLILRGKAEEIGVPHAAVFTCLDCAPDVEPPAPPEPASRRKSKSKSSEGNSSGKIQPRLNTSSSAVTFRKRNKKKFDDLSALTACDVCLRDIAIGAVLADDREVEIEFTVEVVCVRCDKRYMRCSDCGGGGGSRLGAGKWRSVELFENGRKTCRLSHDRLGSLTDMSYDVCSINQIPPEEMTEIVRQCEPIFKNTLIAGMCTPEVLETQSAVAKTYQEIIDMADNGWRGIQQLFRVDIEPSRQIRRYIGVRSCTPNPRKSQKTRAQEVERAFPDGGFLLRAGKDIIGFVLAEWDYLIGSLFLCVVVPWSSGESFDATTRMLVELISKTEADRQQMNSMRAPGQRALPELKQLWTMMFFKKESRMMAYLEKKRGFVPLEEYLAQHDDSGREEFAPVRDCYLPRERQTDWHVLVKRQTGADDWTKPQPSQTSSKPS